MDVPEWAIGLALGAFTGLVGVIWKNLDSKITDNSEEITTSSTTLVSLIKAHEERTDKRLDEARSQSQQALDKLERRYEREMTELVRSLTSQIDKLETSVARQVQVSLELWARDKLK